MADINYDPFNDVTDPDAAVAGINASIASLFPPSALNPFVTLDDLASIKQMNTARLLGRFTAGVGAVEEITIGSGLALSILGVLTATGGGGTLAATLILGNTSGANDIIMSTGQVIKDTVLFNQLNLNYLGQAALTSTAGVGIDAAVEAGFSYTGISNAGDQIGLQQYQIGVELFNDGTRNINNSWSTGTNAILNIGVSKLFGASFDDYQDISIQENTSIASIGNLVTAIRKPVFIGAKNVRVNLGVIGSVVLGGNWANALLSSNNTVYLGNTVNVNNAYVLPNAIAVATGYVMTYSAAGVASWQPNSSGTASLTSTQIGFGNVSNLMTSDTQMVWDNTSKRFQLGIPTIVAARASFQTSTALEYGLVLRSVNYRAALFIAEESGTGTPVVTMRNGSTFTGVADILSIDNFGHANTIGSANLIRFVNDVAGQIIIGKYGMIMTNVTPGVFTADHIWQTTNTTTGVIVERMRLTASGRLGIGTTTPTAFLDVPAYTNGANGINSIRIRAGAGVGPTTPNLGDISFNGTDFLVRAAARTDLMGRVLVGSANLNFALTANGASDDETVTVTGAAVGDSVAISVPVSNQVLNQGVSYTAFVSAANTVTVRFSNFSGAAVNPPSGNAFKATVFKN